MSGICHIKLRLAHAYQTDYVKSGGQFVHLWRFADKAAGYIDEIHDYATTIGPMSAFSSVRDAGNFRDGTTDTHGRGRKLQDRRVSGPRIPLTVAALTLKAW